MNSEKERPTSIKEVNVELDSVKVSIAELEDRINKLGTITVEKDGKKSEFYGVQASMRSRGGAGPGTRVVCRNDGNSWLHEMELARYSASAPRNPTSTHMRIARGAITGVYVLMCPICGAIILTYDKAYDMVNPRDWDDFVEEIKSSMLNTNRGALGEYGTKAPTPHRKRAESGSSFIPASGLETY